MQSSFTKEDILSIPTKAVISANRAIMSHLFNPISSLFSPSCERRNSITRKKSHRHGRICRIEELESRELLAVTFADFDALRSEYSDLHLDTAADETNFEALYNIIEITDLSSDTELREALNNGAKTGGNKDTLIVVRTTATNTMTLTSGTGGGELGINVNEADYGSVIIAGWGTNPLTISANQHSRVFNIAENSVVAMAGLTITGGSNTTDPGLGGGIYNTGSLTMTECTIRGNAALFGGGICSVGTLIASNCTVENNSAPNGGGIYGRNITLTDCTIKGNTATGSDSFGGGMMIADGALSATDCTITENSAVHGGGVYAIDSGSNAQTVLTNCTIEKNSATGNASFGGGIMNDGGTLLAANCTISENSAATGGGIYCYNVKTSSTLSNCVIESNSAASFGGGISIRGGTLTAENCVVTKNSVTTNNGGGIYNENGTLTVTDCTISENSASYSGGGIANGNGTLTMANSTIAGNSALDGGGIYNDGTQTLTNCAIAGNKATGSDGMGGGIFNYGGTTNVTNCTIAGNFTRKDGGGGICFYGGTLKINNSIVAKNSSEDIVRVSGTMTGSNNLIGNGAGQTTLVNDTNGNIVGRDPLFVKIPGTISADTTGTNYVAANWDLRLASNSPAINQGSNALAAGLTADLAGNPRFYESGTVDIGAYEFQGVPVPPSPVTAAPVKPKVKVDKTARTISSITLTWTLDPKNAGYTDENYVITCTGPAGQIPAEQITVTIADGKAVAVATGLEHGKKYKFSIVATNGTVTLISKAASKTVATQKYAAPKKFKAVAKTAGLTSVTLTNVNAWKPSAATLAEGYSVEYEIEVFKGTGKKRIPVGTVTLDSSGDVLGSTGGLSATKESNGIKIAGLPAPGTKYSFVLKAVAALGGHSIESLTAKAGASTLKYKAIKKVSVTSPAAGTATVTLNWTLNTAFEIYNSGDYEVYWLVNKVECPAPIGVTVSGTSGTFTLPPEFTVPGKYTFYLRVKADAVDHGVPSVGVKFKVKMPQ